MNRSYSLNLVFELASISKNQSSNFFVVLLKLMIVKSKVTLVNVYVDLPVFTRIAGTS